MQKYLSMGRTLQGFRKPMLYPLSYEGLPCAFAQRAA
jgi:hypothetical protein